MMCKTASDKLKEAKYFLNELTSDKIYKDDDLYSYYLNASLTSMHSTIEYIISDFLDSLQPKITIKEWKKVGMNSKRQKKIIVKHPQKQKIENFFIIFDTEYEKLRSDPLVYYFLDIRNEAIHHRKITQKGMTVTSTNPQTKKSTKMRTLEMPFNEKGLEKYPQYKIEYPRKFTKEQILKLESDIRHTDAKIHIRRFFGKITEFVHKFEMLSV